MSGRVEIVIGCMFSGKTSALEKIFRQYRVCEIDCVVVNYYKDKRYSNTMLSTHDKTTTPCLFAEKLEEITQNVSSFPVILINEGQFFHDLVPWVEDRLKEKKTIYVCGLDGDFQKNKFGTILDLIPKADMYTKLTALCANCKTGAPAPFTYRKSDDRVQTLIGTTEYIPVCRACNDILNG